MRITRDVVTDLLPLYVAGEASADTRALVEEYLLEDPGLQAEANHARRELAAGPPTASSPLPPDLELRSLRRTRGVLRWQRLTYGWGLALSLLCLTTAFSIHDGQLHVQMLVFEYPRVFIPCAMLAASCWVNYLVLRRRVRAANL
jgi:anti-sigma factor RsiW